MVSTARDEKVTKATRLYTLCLFGRDWTVPKIQFLEAGDDRDALALANSLQPWLEREIWDRHRLVAVLPPNFPH